MPRTPIQRLDPRKGRNIIKIIKYMIATNGGQNTYKDDPPDKIFAEELDIDVSSVSRVRQGERDLYTIAQQAIPYFQKFSFSKSIVLDDLGMESDELVRRLIPMPQQQDELIGRLEHPQYVPSRYEELHKLVGIYACLYVCINIHRPPTEYGIAIDCLEVTEKPDRHDELAVAQINYELEHKTNVPIPRGSVKLLNKIVQFDIGYNSAAPVAKILACHDTHDAFHRYNFISLFLDSKLGSTLIVTRPALLIQYPRPFTKWHIFPKESEIFSAVTNFFDKENRFTYSNYEICPKSVASYQEWIPVRDTLLSLAL